MRNGLENKGSDFGGMRMYLIVTIFMFYTLPVFFLLTRGDMAIGLSMMQLTTLNPLVVLLVTILYTVKEVFDWKFPFIIAGLFVPTVFLFFELNMIVFAFVYLIIAYLGCGIGALVAKGLR